MSDPPYLVHGAARTSGWRSAKIAGVKAGISLVAIMTLALWLPAPPTEATTPSLPADTRFYHAPPNPGAVP